MDVTIEQAARLTGRSTRQVVRWIEGHKVEAHKDANGRWQIAMESLANVGSLDRAALDQWQQEQGITLSVLLGRIEALEHEVKTLKQRAILRSFSPTDTVPVGQAPAFTPSAVHPASLSPSLAPYAPPERVIPSLITESAGRPNLPAGTIRIIDMAKLHDVPAGTLKSQIERRTDLATGIRTASRDGRQERWATPEQQRFIIAYWREQGTRHARCGRPDCACQE